MMPVDGRSTWVEKFRHDVFDIAEDERQFVFRCLTKANPSKTARCNDMNNLRRPLKLCQLNIGDSSSASRVLWPKAENRCVATFRPVIGVLRTR
jgi:hypothetical protein